jgi:Insertion element 4 transposase N-terminal
MLFYSPSTPRAIGAGHSLARDRRRGDRRRFVPAGALALPAETLRRPGGGVPGDDGGAWVTAETAGRLRTGTEAVFCVPLVTAPVVARRDGRVLTGGHLSDHVCLGVLEDHLPAGLIEGLVERHQVRERRLRGLSAGMAVRCVLAMTLNPTASRRQVMSDVAGMLTRIPWARPWSPPGGEVLTRHQKLLGENLFRDLFEITATKISTEPAHQSGQEIAGDGGAGGDWRADIAVGRLGGLLLCAGDGVNIRCPNTKANRGGFGSSGTKDDSSPYPLIRAVLISVCATRAVIGAAVDSVAAGEQTLTAAIAKTCPWVFTGGRLFLFDRNFLGWKLIKKLLGTGGHLLMRMKAGISLPNLGWLPDGSYQSRLNVPGATAIPVRVVDYDVTPPEGAHTSGELFCLVTDLLDHETYPAQALAAAYPWRWTGSETTIKENKSTITGAGPSAGPILRSTTPMMIRQEFWAWLTATNLVRAHARTSATDVADLPPATPTRPAGRSLPARAVSFTLTRLQALNSITQTIPPRAIQFTKLVVSQQIKLNRGRHFPRETKVRQQFPTAKPATTTTATGPGQVLIRAPRPQPDTN